MFGILTAIILATVSAKVPSGFSNGDLLLSDCRGSRQFVAGYVSGWMDKWNRDDYLARRNFVDAVPTSKAMVNSAYFANSIGANFCIPVGTTAAAISDMLCTFLEENPGVRDAASDDLMMTLVEGKYRCPLP